MSFLEHLKGLPDAIALRGFRVRNFSALMGVKQPRELAELLKVDDEDQAYRDVYGLHNLRWILFDPNEKNGQAGVGSSAPHALLLSLVFDGNLDEVLHALLDRAGERVREILTHCFGFGASSDAFAYMKHHTTPSGYFLRDLGPLILPQPRQWSFQYPPDSEPDATRFEIEDAHAIRHRFERFYARSSNAPAGELRKEFLEAFADAAFPLPLTKFERRRSDEESWTRRMIDTSRKLQDKTARSANDRVIRRGAHAKGHGLISATFDVLDSKLRVGLFAKPASYPALLRPSNGFSSANSDKDPDARGLAVRVLIPPSERFGGSEPKFVFPPDEPGPGKQDFVLMNQPVFVAPDLRRFAMWFKTAQLGSLTGKVVGALGLATGPGGLRQALLVLKTSMSRISHPLDAEYHSTTPYLLGQQHVAKYSVEPVDAERFRGLANAADPDSLSAALRASLQRGPILLKFFVHVFPVDAKPKGHACLTDVVEDATLDWRELGAEKVHVANIRISKQDPTALQSLRESEALRFNPWNALADHRPLGSLNRARWAAYRASQRYRSVKLQSSGLAAAAE